jgi:hypothetical protein
MHFLGVTMAVGDRARFAHSRIDVLSVAINTEIMQNAVLPGDLLVYGYQVRVIGTVGGDVDFGGEALIISGVVAGRVDAEVGDPRRNTDLPGLPIYDLTFEDPGLEIGAGAHIGADLAYRSRTASIIPPGVVKGQVAFEQLGRQPDITKVVQPRDFAEILVDYVRTSVRDMITLVFLGVIGLWIVPNLIRQPAHHVRRRTIPTIGWGLIAFMLSIPIVIVVLVIGLLLVLTRIWSGQRTDDLDRSCAALSARPDRRVYLLLLYMGRVVISFTLGQLVDRYVLRSVELTGYRRWVVALTIGTAIYTLIVNVPIPAVGLIVELISSLAGVGAVVMHLRSSIDTTALFPFRDRSAEREATPTISVTLPPVPEEVELGPGMEDLPEGFSGFDEDR